MISHQTPVSVTEVITGYIHSAVFVFSNENDLRPHRRFHIVHKKISIHTEMSEKVYDIWACAHRQLSVN